MISVSVVEKYLAVPSLRSVTASASLISNGYLCKVLAESTHPSCFGGKEYSEVVPWSTSLRLVSFLKSSFSCFLPFLLPFPPSSFSSCQVLASIHFIFDQVTPSRKCQAPPNLIVKVLGIV